jgi:hypothetical protein
MSIPPLVEEDYMGGAFSMNGEKRNAVMIFQVP